MKKTPFPVLIGSDPELMAVDTRTGTITSSMRILKTTKEDPIDLGNGVRAYADNVLIEAAFNPIELMGDITAHFRDVWVRIQERLGDRFHLLPQASHAYDDDQLTDKLKTSEGLDVDAWTIGCTPSFDVYARTMNVPDPFKDNTRSSSMHIHIGNADHEKDPYGRMCRFDLDGKEQAVKVMDVIVGCASAIFDRDPTAAARRALGYGRAGSWRGPDKPYGIEYRALSSWGLRSPELTLLVRDLTAHAMTHMTDGTVLDVLAAVDSDQVQSAINDGNAALAKRILQQASLPAALMRRVEQDYVTPSFNAAWAI